MHERPGNLAPITRFSNRAQNYAKYRPSYPAAMLDFLADDLRFKRGSVVADIGSGTGILSRLLLEGGMKVYGIEPNPQMRPFAEAALGSYADFKSIDATAEATTLEAGSVDAVAAAQAFHWFDHRKAITEFRRIGRPGAWVALIWNVRKAGAPFMAEYERIVQKFGPEVEFPLETLPEIFGPSLKQRAFENSQQLNWEALRGRVLSASYMPAEGDADFEPMIEALREAFEVHQQSGTVRMEYQTLVYFAPLA
jgi:SAM-dependent methyltransferase